MDFSKSLFQGKKICLAPIDYEKDAEVESKWTQDAEYLRLVSSDPARPLSPAQLKKQYEKVEKKSKEDKNFFYFTIRTLGDERLVGFTQLYWIEWNHGNGLVSLGIGDPADRRQGYGTEALELALRFAFDELNLFRLSARVPAYNQVALRLFQNAGFIEEVRRRQAIHRDGRFWDMLHLGVLAEEWRRNHGE